MCCVCVHCTPSHAHSSTPTHTHRHAWILQNLTMVRLQSRFFFFIAVRFVVARFHVVPFDLADSPLPMRTWPAYQPAEWGKPINSRLEHTQIHRHIMYTVQRSHMASHWKYYSSCMYVPNRTHHFAIMTVHHLIHCVSFALFFASFIPFQLIYVMPSLLLLLLRLHRIPTKWNIIITI